jgi:glycosyltransferase involved in cell wall biosynthesis
MPEPTRAAVSAAIRTLLADEELRARLGEAGRRTAANYAWERRIDELEAFLQAVADPPAPDVTAPQRSAAPHG